MASLTLEANNYDPQQPASQSIEQRFSSLKLDDLEAGDHLEVAEIDSRHGVAMLQRSSCD
jgi:hypothetical protein